MTSLKLKKFLYDRKRNTRSGKSPSQIEQAVIIANQRDAQVPKRLTQKIIKDHLLMIFKRKMERKALRQPKVKRLKLCSNFKLERERLMKKS
jgi:hypothetical protein